MVSSGGLTPSGAILLTDGRVSLTAPRPRVVLVDGVPMSGLVAEAADPRAVIVAFHGGASTAAYFDCPGHPRLSCCVPERHSGSPWWRWTGRATEARPRTPDAMALPEQRVAAGLWRDREDPRVRLRGCSLLGHSAGCELVVRMAADERGNGLVGIALAGTGLHYDDAAREILKTATPRSVQRDCVSCSGSPHICIRPRC